MIRFACQHCGHRLVIKKTAWAGQLATCPQCQGQTPIPVPKTDSPTGQARTPEAPTPRRAADRGRAPDDQNETGDLTPDATRVEFSDSPADPANAESFELASEFSAEPPGEPPTRRRPDQAFTLDKPKPLGLHDVPDPIAQKPRKIWYVRIPGRDQLGPLKGGRLREMLDADEIPPEAVVWREDWDDWLSAGQVFPELSGSIDENRLRQERKKSRPRWLAQLPAILAVLIGLAVLVFLTIVLFILINR